MSISKIQKTFQSGETLASEDLNSIIATVNSAIDKLNDVESGLDNHRYDVTIPITNIYCRTKKSVNASGYFPQTESKRIELFNAVSQCATNQGIRVGNTLLTVDINNNADQMNGVWTAYPHGVSNVLPHEWQVSFKKLDNGDILYMYGPNLISNYGFNGTDGDSVQYVYKLFNRELTEQERINNTPLKPISPDDKGEFIPNGWSDEPQGPTANYPYEYVATIKKIQGVWGDFEKIALWSTYSEDGENGDFQSRVFCRFTPTSNKLTPATPVGGTYLDPRPSSTDGIVWSTNIPSGTGPIWTSIRVFKGSGLVTTWSTPIIESDTLDIDIEYSSQQEQPLVSTLRTVPGTNHPSNIWHDPSEQYIDLSTMIWRAERKIKNGNYEGEWIITRMKGEKGAFKSMVFRRFVPTVEQSIPPTPIGGSFNNPYPNGDLWSDGLPDYGDGPIWASTCTFSEDGTSTGWSTPQMQSDDETRDIEFSPSLLQPSNPTGEPFANRSSQGWYDPSSPGFDGISMIWRAERKVVNGSWAPGEDWVVTRIKGEKGDTGYRGNFVSRVFCRYNPTAQNPTPPYPYGGTYDDPVPVNTDGQGNKIWFDGVPEGKADIWSATRTFYGNPEEENPKEELDELFAASGVITQAQWSAPTKESDSENLDIEYSSCPSMPNVNTLRNTVGGSNQTIDANHPEWDWKDPAGVLPNGYSPIWRAERKIHGGEYQGNWVITQIKGEKGDTGVSGRFTSMVFKRTKAVPLPPVGGTYTNPIPTNNDNDPDQYHQWEDTVPQGNEALWMASCYFSGNGDEHTAWAVSLQADSETLDIEFSASNTEPPTSSLRDSVGESHPRNNEYGWYDANSPEIQHMTPIWRAERKIHNGVFEGQWVITRIYGEKGENGNDAILSQQQLEILNKAGLNLVVSPQNFILDQTGVIEISNGVVQDAKLDSKGATSVISFNDGQYEFTDLTLTNPRLSGRNSQGDLIGVDPEPGTIVIYNNSISLKKLPITINSGTYTYNEGILEATANLSYHGTVYQVPIVISWYLNRLGERISKLEGDISETYLSRDIFTNSPENQTIKSEFDAYIEQSAVGTTEEYCKNTVHLVKEDGTLNVVTETDFGNYQRTAETNLANLKKTIISTNILSNEWTDVNGNAQDFTTTSLSYSPVILLNPGVYVLSFYTNDNNLGVSCASMTTKPENGSKDGNYGSLSRIGTLQDDLYTLNAVVYTRVYYRLTVSTSKYYIFKTTLTSGKRVYRQQLEIANEAQVPTPWVPGPTDYTSTLKQTATSLTSRIETSEGNISTLQQTASGLSTRVESAEGNISTLQQTAQGLTSEVSSINPSRNLLKGTLTGTGWRGASSISSATLTTTTAQDGEIYLKNSSYYFVATITSLPKNTYTFSFSTKDSQGTFDFALKNSGGFVFVNTTNNEITSNRSSITFTTSSDYTSVRLYLKVVSPQFSTYPCISKPQLEEGSTATTFCAGEDEVKSLIEQTSSSISLLVDSAQTTANNAQSTANGIVSGLSQTGIVISGENAGITMYANNFRLNDTENNMIFGTEGDSDSMVFSGDLKTGEEDFYHFPTFNTSKEYNEGDCVQRTVNGVTKNYRFTTAHQGAWKTGAQTDYTEFLVFPIVYNNTIEGYGGGRLGGGKIYWNSNGDIYLGPIGVTPKGNIHHQDDFNNLEDMVFEKEYGGKYPSDGLRIINDNNYTTISLQADSNLELSLGKLELNNQGRISVNGYNDNDHTFTFSINDGFSIAQQQYVGGINDQNDLYGFSGALTFSNHFLPKGATQCVINSNDVDNDLSYGSNKFNLRTFVKGKNGKAYKGFTGICSSGTPLVFINGICVGPQSGFSNNDESPWTVPS